MDKPNGQYRRSRERPRSDETRKRLLAAAAELIAECGWGGVTTRAAAERAGLPHGTVNYHFRGKHELLTEAALRTVERVIPFDRLETAETLAELLSLITAWMHDESAFDTVSSGVLMEAMRESARDPELRHHLSTLLADYRRLLAGLVGTEQHRGTVPAGPAPSALATLLLATCDGLLLHALLDPDLDVVEATRALHTLLHTQSAVTAEEHVNPPTTHSRPQITPDHE
ncbi:TetR/AcrR family transcriptional regulator [Actinopolyspora mortivallis]|uniref:TetR family transcriptional regulator n=1 Tax=Actinopolyspora mortivallis TaxID=33906 RepID=A0A2T0H1W5_ACTMO|nr:TetR/AcrR family transcriptional regulator [Actinopolyspora mortivallis]PRW65361.1 TetR family transcriptional regulator [Actinopolyspora mortivallis]